MKIKDISSGVEVQLPRDLLWEDQFTWSPVVSEVSYSLSGAVIIESALKVAGRPITLVAPESAMGWVTKDVVDILWAWSSVVNRPLLLTLQFPEDVRTFDVVFRHAEVPMEAKPVKGFTEHGAKEWFSITLRLMEI